MEQLQEFVKNLISRMGFREYRVDIDPEHKHGFAFIHDDENLIKEQLPHLVESINHVIQLVARKHGEQHVFLDINNYRKEREGLIIELAKAAARKVVATKTEISLPIMNSYERRLAHLELASHPEVMTESVGKGKERYVVVRPVKEDGGAKSQSPSV